MLHTGWPSTPHVINAHQILLWTAEVQVTLKQRKESFVLRRMAVHKPLNVQKKMHYQLRCILSVCFFFPQRRKPKVMKWSIWKESCHHIAHSPTFPAACTWVSQEEHCLLIPQLSRKNQLLNTSRAVPATSLQSVGIDIYSDFASEEYGMETRGKE